MSYSSSIGPKLRAFVETQLLSDWKNYGVDRTDLKFHWSESCIEGHERDYLDGRSRIFRVLASLIVKTSLLQEVGWSLFIMEISLLPIGSL